MQYKTLSLALLSAVALAAPQDAAYYSSLEASIEAELATATDLAELASLKSLATLLPSSYLTDFPAPSLTDAASFTLPPESILSVLETALPFSDYAELATAGPTVLIPEVESGAAWFESLPASVKSYLTSFYADYAAATTAKASMPSSEVTVTAASSTSTGSSESQSTSSGSETSSAASSSAASSSSAAAQSSTSHAGAPAATGAIAFSLAGAAGILGLAIAL